MSWTRYEPIFPGFVPISMLEMLRLVPISPARIGELRSDIDARFTKLGGDIDVWFARLEAKIDEKPGAGTIYQAALAMFTGMFAVIIGTIVALNATGFIQ